jgi:predicted ATPase with chaperone activity
MSTVLEQEAGKESFVAALGLMESFRPDAPASLPETGLNEAFVEDLVLKSLLASGAEAGRRLAESLCLPLPVLENRFDVLRSRQLIAPTGSAMFGDYIYQLTERGRDRAMRAMAHCAYVGPAPVSLEEYVNSVAAQAISAEKPKRPQLEKAFADIHVEPGMYDRIGPAVSAGKGMFIYGAPGNGKTTLARRITHCFGQHILIPHAIVEDGQIIKLFDAACHEPVQASREGILKSDDVDHRWIRVRRPTVVVGGELTMDSLELKHNPSSNVSEASLQLKSNCGCLLIDDFGRQRIDPVQLLNRWIIPLENRIDYLMLPTGKKIEVPFEQLIVFSTNLEPHDLADDAFLRRIPFKIEVGDPSTEEFRSLFTQYLGSLHIDGEPGLVNHLIETHYRRVGRPMRRCHPRDLIDHAVHFCEYHDLPLSLSAAHLDHAVENYFTAVAGQH